MLYIISPNYIFLKFNQKIFILFSINIFIENSILKKNHLNCFTTHLFVILVI
jgi:hypothetical protein